MRSTLLALAIPVLCHAQGTVAHPVLRFAATHHDFGRIDHDRKVSFRFLASNAGGADLRITGLNPSCGCTFGSLANSLLRPGETTEVEVTFDPQDFRGHVRKYLQVTSNDPITPITSLSFEADISRDIVLSTGHLAFHDLLRTSSERMTLKLESDNGKSVEVTGITSTSSFLTAVVHQEGLDAIVEVRFEAPKMEAFQSSGQQELLIHTTNPHFRQIPVTVQWDFRPIIISTPTKVAWVGKAGSDQRRQVVLSHLQGKPFRILRVNPSHSGITVNGWGPKAAVSHTLDLQFTPGAAGAFEASVSFTLDDPDQPEFKLGLVAVVD